MQNKTKESVSDKVIYYETKKSFGLYCEIGLDIEKFKSTMKKLTRARAQIQ